MATLVVARTDESVTAQTLPERAAHDEAARLWFDDVDVLGAVVISDHGVEMARYERPGVPLPASWPPKDAKYSTRELPRLDEAPRAGEGPRVPRPPKVDPGPCCGCCNTPWSATAPREGDTVPTPAGRLNAYRCGECGASLPGRTRMQLERMYLATRRETVHVVEPSPRPRAAAMPPRDGSF